MKHSVKWMAPVFWVCAFGMALGQTKFVTPDSSNSTRIGSPNPQDVTKLPRLQEFLKQFKDRMKQLGSDLKSGKITRDQAHAEQKALSAIHRQAFQFYQDNGKKDLTLSQKEQVEQSLSQQ